MLFMYAGLEQEVKMLSQRKTDWDELLNEMKHDIFIQIGMKFAWRLCSDLTNNRLFLSQSVSVVTWLQLQAGLDLVPSTFSQIAIHHFIFQSTYQSPMECISDCSWSRVLD